MKTADAEVVVYKHPFKIEKLPVRTASRKKSILLYTRPGGQFSIITQNSRISSQQIH